MNPCRCLLALAVACLALPPLMSAENSPPPAPLPTTVFDFAQLEPKPTGMGFFRRVTDQPTATLRKLEFHITQLDPGHLSHQPHQHPQEELILLQQGTLDVQINGHVTRVGPGSAFFFASYDWHNVKSVGDVPALYDVINFATDKTAALPDKTPAVKSAPSGTLPSSVFDWEKLPVETTKSGFRRAVFDSPTVTCDNLECHVTTLNPGEIPHPPHHHPSEEIIVIKEGTLEITANGATHRAGPGSIAFLASNDEHGWRNVGTTPATYYVLRVVTALTPKS